MVQKLNEIVTKTGPAHPTMVADWNTTFQAHRDVWLADVQATIEAHKIDMKKKGKIDQAFIARLNAQSAAQLNFINSAFGTGGGMLAEWKLDFNQRLAHLATMEKTMPAISKQLTTDMDQMHKSLGDIQLGLGKKETTSSTGQDLVKRLDALKTRLGRLSQVVGIRQKVIEPYVKASAYAELKKKLEPILNLLTPEQVAQNPNLSSIPAEVIQILQGWKTILPKKCEDSYGPVWASAKKAIEWVSDPKRLWQSLPFFKEANTFEAAERLLTKTQAAAKEQLEAIAARWTVASDILHVKHYLLTRRQEILSYRSEIADKEPMRSLLDITRKVKEAAAKAEKAGAAFPEAKRLIEQQTQLVRECASLYQASADAHSSPDGREFDELIVKVQKAPDKNAAKAMWDESRTTRNQKIKELKTFVRENEDDMEKLIDEGKLLLTLMK